jgi:hypothetical protein
MGLTAMQCLSSSAGVTISVMLVVSVIDRSH